MIIDLKTVILKIQVKKRRKKRKKKKPYLQNNVTWISILLDNLQAEKEHSSVFIDECV